MKKRSIVISGHSTSISLEEEFWRALNEIAVTRAMSLTKLIEEIDAARAPDQKNLSSALRVYALQNTIKNSTE